MKTISLDQIQDHNHYFHISQIQLSWLTSPLQTSNHQTSFKSLDHISNSFKINKFTFILAKDISSSCIKQFPSNFAVFFVIKKLSFGPKLLSDVAIPSLIAKFACFNFSSNIMPENLSNSRVVIDLTCLGVLSTTL